ncbi:uncharacterized protein LOC134214711 [Armigeres subalbatus]|uniref:uncharacterized protein LOC134214711 n=1 Tax=Armigeres subalbatus TaxID=124917 RepID=UPI002ED077BA
MRTLFQIFCLVATMTTIMGRESIPEAVRNYNLNIQSFQNFQFFKYPGKLTPYGVRPGNHNPSWSQKAAAVFKYFKDVAVGPPMRNYGVRFDEKRALRLRSAYQKQFGYRGENLVALIGNGHSPQELRYYGAIGRDFGPY